MAVTLSYIEGWHAIDEANRVFGFEGWDRETLCAERVWEDGRREPKACSYAVRVRIRVRAGRDPRSVATAQASATEPAATLGEAHESALKEAETDATKRALTTFGNLFGLALYDKAQNGVKRSAKPSAWGGMFTWLLVSARGDLLGKYRNPQTFCAAMRDVIGKALVPEDLDTLWLRNGPAVEQLRTACPDLRTSQGSHYADILERLYRGQLAKLTGAEGQEPGTGRIDKSELALATPKRLRDEAHRKFVAGLPCLICGRAPTQAHHLRFAQPRSMGSKVSDEYTVPLCALHHRSLHDDGPEENWWSEHKIEPLKEAERLWRESHVKLLAAPSNSDVLPSLAKAGE